MLWLENMWLLVCLRAAYWDFCCLLIIFINDLRNAMPQTTNVALYADDTKSFRGITSEGDCCDLQQALSNLSTWSSNNNISFNKSKCKTMTVTRKKQPFLFIYHLDLFPINKVQEEKDLGVLMTSILSWDSHIQRISAKANRMLGLLKRTCSLLTQEQYMSGELCIWPLSNHKYATQAKSGLLTRVTWKSN
jgi:hypothetical protein